MSYYMNIKTNALENEKVKVTEKEQKYEGDCVDENVALSDDIVIKIIILSDVNWSVIERRCIMHKRTLLWRM